MSENQFDLSDEELDRLEARAESLVAEHDKLRRELVALRTKGGLSQSDVAERMSVSQPRVAEFERYDGNPTLSTIRRYALAVGAHILHTVIDDSNTDLEVVQPWVSETTEIAIRKTEEVLRGLPVSIQAGNYRFTHEEFSDWMPATSIPVQLKARA